MPFDPTAPFCSFCYKQNADTEQQLKRCGKCHMRQYCSQECQTDDWHNGHHQLFCGKAGEIGLDYEIRPIDGKGLGVFAKRDLKRNDTIFVELPVVQPSDVSLPEEESVQEAIMALTPTDSSFQSKYEHNNVGRLCLTFSRVNHDCIGNSHHSYDDEKGLFLLVANHTIPAGEEITCSYTFQTLHAEALEKHATFWDFRCECRACKNPEIAEKLDQMVIDDEQTVAYSRQDKFDEGTRTALDLIKLYDEFQSSSFFYSRVYNDLYKMAITKRETFKQGMVFIKLALKHSIGFFGYESLPVRNKQHNMLHPTDSGHYLILES
jgi:hypothetical protein